MILWRPTNALRSDYLQVPITDEEELEQSVNKNLGIHLHFCHPVQVNEYSTMAVTVFAV